MLQIAMLYRYLDVMILILIAIVLFIIVMKISIVHEQRLNEVRKVRDMKILFNRVADPAVPLKGFKLVPGTDYVYVPVYGYTLNGKTYETFSYRKCRNVIGPRNAADAHRCK